MALPRQDADFERLETAIDTGLVDRGPASRLFGYWVNHFERMPEHFEWRELAHKYIDRYASISTFYSLWGRL